MGFWAGVVGEMNRIEDRNERRDEFNRTLREKRLDTIMAAAAQRGAVATTGAGGLSTTTSGSVPEAGAVAGHYAGILINDFGADPEKLSSFSALGEAHVSEIYDAVNTVRQAYDDAGRLAEFTPDVVNNVLEGVRVTVKQGGSIAWKDLAEMAGLNDISEEDAGYINAVLGSRPASATVTVLGSNPQFPLPQEDIQRVKDAATADVVSNLESKRIALTELSQAGTITAEQQTELSNVSRAIETINENEGNVPNWVISQYGASVIAPYVANEPRLLRGNMGGVWDTAIQQLRNTVFSSEAAATEAFNAGRISVGDTIYINGQQVIVE